MNKRALSPVIATVLLIALVLMLASIVYFWAKSFLPEQLEKNGGPVENVCAEVRLVAEYDPITKELKILNQGNVPVYSAKIGIQSSFSLEYINEESGMPPIKANEIGVYTITSDIQPGDQIVIVPVLLGENAEQERKSFVCDAQYGLTVNVPE